MTKKVVALLATFSLMLGIAACDAVVPSEISSPTEKVTPSLTPTPTPVPDTTPYKTMNVGSSKKLQGNCVFINIFLSDGECSPFTEAEKEDQMGSLYTAINYLSKHAEKYNQSVSFIYNTEDTNIDYTVDYIIPRSSKGDWPYKELIAEIRSQYDIDDIMKKYNADNLSFILNINKSGKSHAIQCVKNIQYDEAVVIYNYHGYPDGLSLEDVTYGGSDDYAHEILHLFGAIDLYNLDKERLSLAKEYFPDDIMLTGDMNLTEGGNTLCILDAYLIGWVNELTENYYIFLE